VVHVEESEERPSLSIIWQRFPKFVLGFIVASLMLTFGIIQKGTQAFDVIQSMKDWLFCAAFVCMGLELSLVDFKKQGWAPFIVYIIVTIFNTLLALIIAYIVFGILFPF
jgi:uncharacterized membrane protein YadS